MYVETGEERTENLPAIRRRCANVNTLHHQGCTASHKYHDRAKKLDSELHGMLQYLRGPIESQLNECIATVDKFLPHLLAATGVLFLTSAYSWASLYGKWLHKFANISLTLWKPKPCSNRSLHAKGAMQSLEVGRSLKGLGCSPLLSFHLQARVGRLLLSFSELTRRGKVEAHGYGKALSHS